MKITLDKLVKLFSNLIILSGLLFPQDMIFSQARIAILYSEFTEQSNVTNSNKIIDVITSWELFLMQDKIPYSVIYDDDLESGIDDEFDILILPSVKLISFEQMEELQKFLESGNSIISSGSKLEFQENSLNEYQNLKVLFGLNSIKSLSSESLSYLHSLIPNHLNNFNLKDESVLQISNKNEGLNCNVNSSKFAPCGFYFDNDDHNSTISSIIYGTNGYGKFLFTGFDINDIIGGKEDLNAFKKIVLNAISWMDNKPDSYIDIFCDTLYSPVIVTLQYNNALEPELIDVLQKYDIEPNLILNPDQKVSGKIVSKFTNDELILDLSGINNNASNNLIESIENFNRDNEVDLCAILVDKRILGNNDLSLLRRAGISIVLYNEQSPGLPKFDDNDLFLVPYVRSELHPFSANVINFLNYNPKIDCAGNPEDELLDKINKIKTSSYNFTSLPPIKKWWNLRERIVSEIKNISDNEFEVWVTNKNSSVVSDIKVFINYVKKIERKNIAVSLNNTLLEHYLDDVSGSIVIKLENVLPNSVNKIKINFTLE